QRGRTGFASQSGALGLVAVEQARAFGLGISSFISVGNKADISGNDLLNYWESDPDTDVVMLYLESFGNPIKFSRIARRVGHTKPIIAVKSGRSKAGARATSSHTGALLAASDVTVDALFRQAGVIRANTFEEMFATAALLGNQPLPRGHRVAIVTNVGGPAILCADACEGLGLELPVLSEATQERLRAFLPEEASVGNPVDLIASATAEQYRQAIEAVTADPGVDAVVAMFIPPLATRTEEIAAAITEATQAGGDDKPLVAVFMTADRPATIPAASPRQVPVYSFPETAATALANATRYAIWRARPLTPPGRPPGLRTDEAAAIVAGALGRGGGWLEPAEVAALLACYGIPMVESVSVGTPDEAAAAARTLGDEVALKAIAPGLSHKTELGAVRLGLRGPAQVGQAAREMAERLTGAGYTPSGFLLQPMIRGGVEMLVGIVRDPSFGPVVAIGAGGTLTELLQDVSVRLAPFVGDEPRAMIRELKTYPLLDGYRGGPHYDIAALEDILLRAGALAEDLPPVIECDLNPVVVLEASAVVLDARVRVAPLRPPEPAPHPA
ncbi:MAG TPA: acetate--CoA ligase family protein, partial [Nitrolancea sp.]|nr:acetate--CoA ligase family protein [Nitrolancea sp.]